MFPHFTAPRRGLTVSLCVWEREREREREGERASPLLRIHTKTYRRWFFFFFPSRFSSPCFFFSLTHRNTFHMYWIIGAGVWGVKEFGELKCSCRRRCASSRCTRVSSSSYRDHSVLPLHCYSSSGASSICGPYESSSAGGSSTVVGVAC